MHPPPKIKLSSLAEWVHAIEHDTADPLECLKGLSNELQCLSLLAKAEILHYHQSNRRYPAEERQLQNTYIAIRTLDLALSSICRREPAERLGAFRDLCDVATDESRTHHFASLELLRSSHKTASKELQHILSGDETTSRRQFIRSLAAGITVGTLTWGGRTTIDIVEGVAAKEPDRIIHRQLPNLAIGAAAGGVAHQVAALAHDLQSQTQALWCAATTAMGYPDRRIDPILIFIQELHSRSEPTPNR